MNKIEGLLLAILLTVGYAVFPALINFNSSTIDHPGQWVSSLVVSVVVAIGVGGYTWYRQQGYTVTIAKPTTEPIGAGDNASGPTGVITAARASPIVLPESWANVGALIKPALTG